MSISYKEAQVIAEKYDQRLTMHDPRFRLSAKLVHADGSELYYESAFIMLCEDFIIVFTAHHKFHIYHYEDVVQCYNLGKFEVEELIVE